MCLKLVKPSAGTLKVFSIHSAQINHTLQLLLDCPINFAKPQKPLNTLLGVVEGEVKLGAIRLATNGGLCS